MALQQAGLEWINKGLGNFVSGVQTGARAMDQVGSAAESVGPRFSALTGIISGISSALTTVFVNAVGKATQAVTGLVSESIGMASEFQAMTARLELAGAASLDVAEQFGGFSELALAVGGDTRLLGVSATGAADAMTGLLKAGLSLDDVMGDVNGFMSEGAELGGALRAAIDLAAASELDMVEASDLAAVTLASFGSQAEEAGLTTDEFINQAMNNFVMAADASVASVPDLRDALINVGPAAAGFGFTLEETNNALAILSTRGINGAEAGTALKSMFTNLMRTTPAVTGALEEQGIALFDAEGNMFSMIDIVGQFQVATETMTEAQRNQFIQTVAGTYGMNAMNTLLAEGVEGWVEMSEATSAATTISASAARQAETHAGQLEALEGNMETLKIRIGSAFMPALTSMMGIFSRLIDKIGPGVTEAFGEIGAFASDLIERVVMLAETFSEGGFDRFFTTFEDGSSAIGDFLQFLGLTEEQASTLGYTINKTVVWIRDTFNSISEWFQENGPFIEAALQTIGEVFGVTFQTVKDIIVNDVWPELQTAFDSIKEALAILGIETGDTGSTIETVAKIISAVIIGLGGVISVVLNTAAGIIRRFADYWKESADNVKGIIDAIKLWLEGFQEVIIGIFTGDWEKARKGFLKAWTGVLRFFKNLGKQLIKSFTMPFKIIGGVIKDFVQSVINFFQKLADKLVGRSIIPDMMEKMEKVIIDILEAIAKFIERILDAIADTFERVFSAIVDTVDRILSALAKVVEDILEDISDFIEKSLDSLVDFISDTLDTIKQIWEDAWDAVSTAVSTAWDAITLVIQTKVAEILQFLSDSVALFVERGEQIVGGIRDGIVETWNVVLDAVSNGINSIGTRISGMIETIKAFGKSIVTHIADGFKEAWTTATGIIGAIRDKFGALVTDIGTLAWGKVNEVGATIVEKIRNAFSAAWAAANGIVDQIKAKFGTLVSDVGDAWASIAAAGRKIVNMLMEGIDNAWDAFITWLESKIIGWFGGSEPRDPASPFRSTKMEDRGEFIGNALVRGMQNAIDLSGINVESMITAVPAIAPITNIRETNVNINASYADVQSEAGIAYDVGAALQVANL